MRLFRKKRPDWEDGERCPRCRERIPEGAIECMMCGLALAPLRGDAGQAQRNEDSEMPASDRHRRPDQDAHRLPPDRARGVADWRRPCLGFPGALGALGASYAYGGWKDKARGIVRR